MDGGYATFKINELESTINQFQTENKQPKELLQKLAGYADTSWYQGSDPHSVTARFFRAMRAIERHIDQALQETSNE